MSSGAGHTPLIKSMVAAFFDVEGLQRMVTYLCNVRLPGSLDPVTSTVLDLLTGRLQFCLTETGLAPLRAGLGWFTPTI